MAEFKKFLQDVVHEARAKLEKDNKEIVQPYVEMIKEFCVKAAERRATKFSMRFRCDRGEANILMQAFRRNSASHSAEENVLEEVFKTPGVTFENIIFLEKMLEEELEFDYATEFGMPGSGAMELFI